MFPFFFSPPEHKIEVMTENLRDLSRLFKGKDGWIHIEGLHFVLRYIWACLIMLLQYRMILRNWNFDHTTRNIDNRPLFWFIITLTVLYTPLIIPGIFGVMLHLSWYTMDFVNITLSLTLFATLCFLLFSPGLLYGFLPNSSIREIDLVHYQPGKLDKLADSVAKNSNLRDIHHLKGVVEQYIQENKPYLQAGYTIHDLARDINHPVYQISPMINQVYGVHFNSWLNKYRIEHFIGEIDQGKSMQLTFDALAKQAGFSSRVTFINAFKKEKGLTPGAYFKKTFS